MQSRAQIYDISKASCTCQVWWIQKNVFCDIAFSFVDTGSIFCVFSFTEVDTMDAALPITRFLCPSFFGFGWTSAPLSEFSWKRCLFSPVLPVGSGGNSYPVYHTQGIAGPLSVVKLHIALDHVDEFFPAFTLIKFEIDVLFGQLPASSGFIW